MTATLIEILPLLMFAVLTPLLFSGYPVAFILGGVGLLFWLLAVGLGLENPQSFFLVITRIYGGVVSKLVLVAIPMFIFMGVMLERCGIARDLLLLLQRLTRRVPGGLALSVTGLGVILAATTGIIGASVVMMTLMALPVMLERGYDKALSTGTIAASGTLGILLPPSIMLVVMADLLVTSAGQLFMAALFPSLLLAGLYMGYIFVRARLQPDLAPAVHGDEDTDRPVRLVEILSGLMPPLLLILLVLGSIFTGVATPTEASGVGAFGATVLALLRKRLTFKLLQYVTRETALTSAMLFGLFIGATAFSYVFTLLGGHDLILSLLEQTGATAWTFLALLMIVTFVLGFFFDWIEITLIILPVFAPILAGLDFGDHISNPSLTLAWFAVLMALNLQTSFLTPPFGFALFYMKGAAGSMVSMQHIYKGIIPFVILQLIGLIAVMVWPEIALWLPVRALGA